MINQMFQVLRSLLGLGKKNPEQKSELYDELRKISGVGSEFAERLVVLSNDGKTLKNLSDKRLRLMLPDNVAEKVIRWRKK